MDKFKIYISDMIAGKLNLPAEKIMENFSDPPDAKLGDLAFATFFLAKEWRKAPNQIAAEIANMLEPDEFVPEFKATGPFINFRYNREKFLNYAFKEFIRKKDKFGLKDIDPDKRIVIDFSSPNIAKPFGVHHLRSTVIGNSLYRIFTALGYKVISINHIGDWGTQFGKLIVAHKLWGKDAGHEDLDYDIWDLYELYKKFHEEKENKPELENEARNAFKEFEKDNHDYLKLWQKFIEISLDDFNEIYMDLGIEFDLIRGEAYYNKMAKDIIEMLNEKGLTEESEGALIIRLSNKDEAPLLLRKKDGTTLYATRDIAAAIDRWQTFRFEQSLYVVGSGQSFNFKQLFEVLRMAGFDWVDRCKHIAFGMMRLKEGKMSSRHGRMVFLKDLLDESIKQTLIIINEKNPELEEKEKIAKIVGYGAVIFNDLMNDPKRDITFSFEKALDFNGETAPYIQYVYTRIRSIFRKAGIEEFSLENYNFDGLKEDMEFQLARQLMKFQDIITDAGRLYKPSLIAGYLINLAKMFNKYYHNYPVLKSKEQILSSRLALCHCVSLVIKNGLSLLGINVPERM